MHLNLLKQQKLLHCMTTLIYSGLFWWNFFFFKLSFIFTDFSSLPIRKIIMQFFFLHLNHSHFTQARYGYGIWYGDITLLNILGEFYYFFYQHYTSHHCWPIVAIIYSCEHNDLLELSPFFHGIHSKYITLFAR